MNEKHYKEKLSEFINHALANDERQAVAEHLLQCAECRAEHDEIKLGATLAAHLKQTDAPENLWHKIENSLDGKREKTSVFPTFAFFSLRGLAVTTVLLAVGLAAVYFVFLRNDSPQIVRNEPPTTTPQIVSPPNEIIPNQNQTAQTNAANQSAPDANLNPQTAASNIKISPENPPVQPKNVISSVNLPAWNVETLAGMPKAGDQILDGNGKLTVGEILETDAVSKAKIQVANIGNVEIAPNSRVKLVNTKATEHRLSLEKGALKAKILAPPRLFIVDTPSGAAVDLGCEYTLEVDAAGNSRLHVTSGYVALENGKFESIVPAGAIALTRKGKGVGTPFSEDASAVFQNALYKFDFENGGRAALETIIKEAGLYDSISLWHLLARTQRAERARIFDALAAQVKPPVKVTREGILRLDKKMLDAWWTEIETVWFE